MNADNKDREKFAKSNARMLHLHIGMMTALFAPFMLVAQLFISRRERGLFWRKAGVFIVQNCFHSSDVHLKVHHRENILTNEPAIYTSNHPSEMDGFMLLAILGPNNLLFTAPLRQFNPLLAFWLRKMETISVKRDAIDDLRYPQDHTKEEAIHLAIRQLRKGHSLIIFPEGHIELMHILHYFHTGAARISLGSHTPIVPVAINDADRVFPTGETLYPGVVSLSFSKAIEPPKTFSDKALFPKAQVLRLRDTIEDTILANLPLRYAPAPYFLKSKKVGVFVDIDRTIYNGFSQQDLIKYFLALHKIHYREVFKVFYWLFLEKMHEMEHKDLMKRSLLVLHGWDMNDLSHLVHRTFEKKLLKNIQYGLFPILKDHAEENHSIIFVSEVIHPLAHEFKNFFGARATLDTKMATEHHCYTGHVNCLCYKEEKALLLEKFADRAQIDLPKSFAYADSVSDIPFMELVGHPVAINPDSALYSYAEEQGYPIIADVS